MVTVYFGDDLARYGFGEGHPFGPDRIHAFWAESVKRGLHRRVEIALPFSCAEDDLLRFHQRAYVERVKARSKTGTGFLDCGDTPAFPGIFEAACFVVGSDLDGLSRMMSGDSTRVLIPIAGLHHGRRDCAAGFCAFNDCGVLIETLRERFGLRRIAYVDIDAHHGDGVFYAYQDDPELIFADIHEDGRYLYPGTGFAEETGTGEAAGTKLNVPLAPGSDDADFHRVWPEVEAFVRAGRPEIILFQAGADSIRNDPITHMAFTPAAHGHAARRLCRLADELCAGRLIVMGGGGYNRTNLAHAWNEVLEAMVA
jgi:acetoin utilization protein AcuC